MQAIIFMDTVQLFSLTENGCSFVFYAHTTHGCQATIREYDRLKVLKKMHLRLGLHFVHVRNMCKIMNFANMHGNALPFS